MSGIVNAGVVNPRMMYTRENAIRYAEGTGADPTSCNSFIASVFIIGDVLAAPAAHIRGAQGSTVTVTVTVEQVDGQSVAVVGREFIAPIADVPQAQRDYVLALRDVCRESSSLRTLTTQVITDARGAGINPWFLGGALILVIVAYLGDRAIQSHETLRREHMQLAQAGTDAIEQLRVERETGTRPAPTPTQVAVADAIRTRAQREAANPSPFAPIAEGVRTGLSWGIPLTIGLILLMLMNKKK